jgi:hypothetical protein
MQEAPKKMQSGLGRLGFFKKTLKKIGDYEVQRNSSFCERTSQKHR